MIPRVKGTQDICDIGWYAVCHDVIKKHLAHYQHKEIVTPLLEYVSLFKRTVGIHTDVVSKEMFLIKSGADEDEICLRPEITAPTVRAYLSLPVKQMPWSVYSYGACFRYERPQKGRLRQFNQYNIEVINGEQIAYDAQMIIMLHDLFTHKLPVGPFELRLNFLGCAPDRHVYKQVLKDFLKNHVEHLCVTCVGRIDTNTLRVFDCKNDICQKWYANAPAVTHSLCQACTDEWSLLLGQLTAMGVVYALDSHLVRGLDYYEKTVFEFTSNLLGAQSTFCGGGRYELASLLGAKERVPSVGAAIGIERLVMMIQTHTLQEVPVEHMRISCVILPLGAHAQIYAHQWALQLRTLSIPTSVVFQNTSLKALLKKADSMGSDLAIIVGDNEIASGTVWCKWLKKGYQDTVASDNLLEYCKQHCL